MVLIKKTIGIIIIIISVFILSGIFSTIPFFFDDKMKDWIPSIIFSIVLFILLSYGTYSLGIKIYRSAKHTILSKKNTDSIIDEIEINVDINRSEFIKLNFILAYTNKFILFLTILGIGLLLSVLTFFHNREILEMEDTLFPTFQIVFGIIFVLIIPISILINSTNSLKRNIWLKSNALYKFNSEFITFKNDSIDLTIKWNTIKSIKELNEWFVIYTNKNQGFFIPKRCFLNRKTYLSFKTVLENLHSIQKNLL